MSLPSILAIPFFLFAVPIASAEEQRVIPVSSPAFFFSPGNWTGDAGRGGNGYRQTWVPGAYFRVSWSTTNAQPTAELRLDVSTFGTEVPKRPALTYCIDGTWVAGVACDGEMAIAVPPGAGTHLLTVYVQTSEQVQRWGAPGASGRNVVRVKGLAVDVDGKPVPVVAGSRWALIVGDSITEGNAADFGKSDNLASWSYFVGRGLQALGYEYGLSACGYSGWLRPGDASHDVPGYYVIAGSANGTGGKYDDARSRWNKLDGFGPGHSLLDAKGHLSGHGAAGQEPGLILINYGTNDALSKVNASDLQASITQGLGALRKAAPEAGIFLIVPFGQYGAETIKAALAAYRKAVPDDRRVGLIDLGPSVAKTLATNGVWSGLHPNMRAHAEFASVILAQVFAAFSAGAGRVP